MNPLKLLCGLLCLVLLISNVRSTLHWDEARGVYDDICYLRQAHLFQRFGLNGFDTDVSRDDDHFLAWKLKQIGYSAWSDPTQAPCHVLMRATGKRVVQYPPGTGLLLALFPPGSQVVSLYILATITVFGFALLAVSYASSTRSILLASGFGLVAIYMMINPTKASYSMAPTMVVCALVGFLTAAFCAKEQHKLSLALAIGFLIGISVNFRLANLFLSAGYFLMFLSGFLRTPGWRTLALGFGFTVAVLVGMSPTLLANTINAGSPFATTYGTSDVLPPQLSLAIVGQYLTDMQFGLIALSIFWTAWIWPQSQLRQIFCIVLGNLVANLGYFLTHPVVTPYYMIPVAALSLWTLLFASVRAAGAEHAKVSAGGASQSRREGTAR
jgi:hypothetical protein